MKKIELCIPGTRYAAVPHGVYPSFWGIGNCLGEVRGSVSNFQGRERTRVLIPRYPGWPGVPEYQGYT
eukprot:3261402-Rhodomonas_salina.1